MRAIRCVKAETLEQIQDAQRVRWQVYGEEEGLLASCACHDGREIDRRDYEDRTTHFVAYAGGEPVGTVRLVASARPADGAGFDLDLESKFDLMPFVAPGLRPAEVTRFCILRRHRRTMVTKALFSALGAESERRGVTHWLAAANMQTDFVEEATMAYLVAKQKKLMSERFCVVSRGIRCTSTPRMWHCYSEAQRERGSRGDLAGIDLPPTLALFANRMAARYIGPPVFDNYFNVFALPLVATVAEANAVATTNCQQRRGAVE